MDYPTISYYSLTTPYTAICDHFHLSSYPRLILADAKKLNTGKGIKDKSDKENKGKDKDKPNETVDETGEKVPKSKAKAKAKVKAAAKQ